MQRQADTYDNAKIDYDNVEIKKYRLCPHCVGEDIP